MSKPVIFNRATQQPPKAGPWRAVANMLSDIRGRLGLLEQRPLVRDGRDGTAGRDGIDGKDGRDGVDGPIGDGLEGWTRPWGSNGVPGLVTDKEIATPDEVTETVDPIDPIDPIDPEEPTKPSAGSQYAAAHSEGAYLRGVKNEPACDLSGDI